jgi:hypothetical protein
MSRSYISSPPSAFMACSGTALLTYFRAVSIVSPEGFDSMFLPNVGIYVRFYITTQPRRTISSHYIIILDYIFYHIYILGESRSVTRRAGNSLK